MLESGKNWELFGHDMRHVGRYWLDAWRELLWGYDSPVRLHLDDAVLVRSEEGESYYQAGKPSAIADTKYRAILLPEDLVLCKTLNLPAVVEVDLAAVLALEVSAYSPFSADDTGYGWRILHRDESQIQVALVMLSRSAAMTYLGRRFDAHDFREQEVWVRVGGEMVVIQGFGEAPRERNYRKRLIRVAAMLLAVPLLVLSIAGAAAGFKALELGNVQDMYATTERDSTEASQLRASLGLANEMIAAVNQIVTMYPNPHVELSRLTHLLGDGEYIEQFSMKGPEIALRGRASDAASVMQRLTDEPDYAEVTAPRAITRMKGTQTEQFYLDIRRRQGESP
ncbi:MAG: PilN domain-containing protein [Halioglobus sp.]